MSKYMLACTLFLLGAAANAVQLVRDVNAVPRDGLTGGSSFSQAVQTTNGTLFLAQDADHGLEPWVSDGTPAGTRLLKDINAGPASSEIDKVTLVNGVAMFMANDGVNGMEIWRSDGTPDGTRLVANIGPGSASGVFGIIGHQRPFPVIGNVMYFNASTDGATGEELWRTDGTAAGTYRLTDGVPGSLGIQPTDFHVVGTRLYFLATDSAGEELWTSDGTVSGSRRVADINTTMDRHIGWLRVVGDVLFFGASNATNGPELWRANAAGNAAMVVDLIAGSNGSAPGLVGVGNDRLIFQALTNSGYALLSITPTGSSPTVLDHPSPGYQIQAVTEAPGGVLITWRDKDTGFIPPLYMTDGTTANTGFIGNELRMTYAGSSAREGNWIYFFGNPIPGAPANIYRSGGTVASTTLYATIDNPAPDLNLVVLNGRLYFYNGQYTDPVHGREVWSADGTPIGMQMLADTSPGTADTRGDLKVVGNRLYLSLLDGVASIDPWATDGVAAPTQLADLSVSSETDDSEPAMLGNAGSYTLFSADDGVHGVELWSTNGTDAGTGRLTDFPDGNDFEAWRGFLAMNGFGLFAGKGPEGTELWRTDGTPTGTFRVKDIAAGIPSSEPRLFTGVVMNGIAYFVATDNVHGAELWRSDGTEAGTWMVFDAVPGAGDGSSDMIPATANGRVFTRGGMTNPPTIYASDGTEAGSVIVSGGANISYLPPFVLNGRVCMNIGIVNTGTSEYFCSNGTAGNFTQLTDFQGMGLSPSGNAYALNGVALMSTLVTGTGTTGGIYAFDGSGAPPVKISDIRFTQGVYIDGGTRLAFGADIVGGDIWVTDGTAVGTHSMLDGIPAPPRTQIQYGAFAGVNDSVVFRVNDPVNGPVVWKTDGTAAGTRYLFDVDPGSTDNRPPSGFLQNGNRVYFTAFRSGIGNEPWFFNTVSPNASDDFAETAFGTAVNVSITANDSDFDSSLSAPGIEILTTPVNGTATLSSGVITYTPNAGFSGIDRFTYRVLDAQGNPSNSAWVSVTTRAAASSANPGTAPAPPPPPPPSGGGGGSSGGGGGGGGALGWEVLLLALLLVPRLRQSYRRGDRS